MKKSREKRLFRKPTSAKEIIKNHLIKKPQYLKLSTTGCFEKIVSILPPTLRDGVSFVYQKNRVLFFALKHPGIKMELDYNHNLIKSLLNKIKTIDKNCADIEIDQIKSFVTYKAKNKEKLFSYSCDNNFYEKSKGEFKNLANNSTLKEEFEEIRKIIKDGQN